MTLALFLLGVVALGLTVVDAARLCDGGRG